DDHESAGGSGRFTRAGPTVRAVGDVWVRRKKLPTRRSEAFASRQELLDGDAGAGRLELGLGLVGGFLGDLLQQRLGRAVDQVLGLLEARAGESAGFFSCSAASSRAICDAGALNRPAALARLPFIAPASLASNTSRDSRSAMRSTSATVNG